ncbi:MAG: DNA topoisomerase IB [Candidatus Dormibacteraceae bacterium]
MPGLRRFHKSGGFGYMDADGSRVRDRATLERVAALAVPPAWNDVWICASARGHLQGTGRDARRRKQYLYHPRWREVRDETKYGSMLAFARALPAIRARVRRDLSGRGLPRDKVLATLVRLLDESLIRVGSSEYARDNGSYGLTTLRDRHVRVSGETLRFRFRGKSSRDHALAVHDRAAARVVRRLQELRGQELFQYLGEDGGRHGVDSADVNVGVLARRLARPTGKRAEERAAERTPPQNLTWNRWSPPAPASPAPLSPTTSWRG